MANKVFKGFKQVTVGTFEEENGYIYFVRNSENTGKTDGYILFNGRKYGTAAEAKAELQALIGTLPEGNTDVVSYVNSKLAELTSGFVSNEVTGSSHGVEVSVAQSGGNVTAVTVTAPDFDNTYAGKAAFEAVSGVVDTINADYLTSNDRVNLENSITAETAARESADGVLSGRIDALEAISADTRIPALEASAHTHDNKDVLDGITQAKINQWDGMSSGASVVLSAYTGSDAGLTEGYLKTYEIFQGGVSVGKIDIPKDLVVSSGQIVEENGVKYLRLTIANSSTPVDIAVTDLVDVYTPGNGIEISNSNEISAKVVSANGLSVDANGIAMGLADGSNNGAMSSADFTKLGTIEASAQTNVIETVKVNGTALTVTDKAVDVVLPDYTDTYAPKSLTGTVETNRSDFDTYTSATDNRLATIESGYTQKATYDAYTAATDASIASADTRLATIESGYTQKATYDAYTAATDASIASADTRLATIESGYTQKSVYDAYTAATDASIASADTRLQALEALTGDTDSALQSISAADNSVAVGQKDSNKNQTVGVKISATANNALSLNNDGLFAAIYYDGNDSE